MTDKSQMRQGGQIIKYSVILVCGNYNGLIGFAKTKAPAVPVALRKVSGLSIPYGLTRYWNLFVMCNTIDA